MTDGRPPAERSLQKKAPPAIGVDDDRNGSAVPLRVELGSEAREAAGHAGDGAAALHLFHLARELL